MSEDAKIEAAIAQAEALTSRPDWQEAAKRRDYSAMRAMMEAQGFDDKLIDVIFWKITGSMQRFIWWQSLLKNCLLLAFFWGVFFAVDKSLPWQFSPLFLVLLTATDYWTFRRSQRPRND